jgi:hypothetical protein
MYLFTSIFIILYIKKIWTIQRNWKHWVHNTQEEEKKNKQQQYNNIIKVCNVSQSDNMADILSIKVGCYHMGSQKRYIHVEHQTIQ